MGELLDHSILFYFILFYEAPQEIIDFVREVKEPAIKMIKLYLAQAVMTATYIYSLSCVGKYMYGFIVSVIIGK